MVTYTDQQIRDKGYLYIPKQKYLQKPFELPENQEPVVDQGIVNTNAFTNSGSGDGFSPTGNMFGEGTAVSPVFGNSYIDTVRREGADSFAAYDKLSQAGGTAPAGMFQTDYFPGTENELVDAMGRVAGEPGYNPSMDYSEDAFQKAEDKRGFLSRLMNNAKQKMTGLPDWAQAAITTAGMLNPFTVIPKLLGMSTGDSGPSYGIAGLTDRQKNMYDSLASEGMLYETPGGYKTFDGKNFSQFDQESIKDFYDNKINRFGSIQNYRDYLEEGGIKKDPKNVKNLIKTLKMYDLANTSDKQFTDFNSETIKDPAITADLVNEFATNNDSGSGTPPGFGITPQGNYVNQFEGGDPGQGGTTSGATGTKDTSKGGQGTASYGQSFHDYAKGGRAGYFYGGRVNFKYGGLASIL
jgi:hypothetical protein